MEKQIHYEMFGVYQNVYNFLMPLKHWKCYSQMGHSSVQGETRGRDICLLQDSALLHSCPAAWL